MKFNPAPFAILVMVVIVVALTSVLAISQPDPDQEFAKWTMSLRVEIPGVDLPDPVADCLHLCGGAPIEVDVERMLCRCADKTIHPLENTICEVEPVDLGPSTLWDLRWGATKAWFQTLLALP